LALFSTSSRSKIYPSKHIKNPRARKQQKQQQQHALTKEELTCAHTHSVLLVSDEKRSADGVLSQLRRDEDGTFGAF